MLLDSFSLAVNVKAVGKGMFYSFKVVEKYEKGRLMHKFFNECFEKKFL